MICDLIKIINFRLLASCVIVCNLNHNVTALHLIEWFRAKYRVFVSFAAE